MKKSLLPFLFLVLSHFCNTAQAQWTSLGSGITATQRALACVAPVNENIVWGFTWHASQFVPTHEITRTTDGGQTWLPGTLSGVSSDQFPIYIHPLDAQTAWLATADEKTPISGKIYKTTNGGASWVHQSTGFTGFNETPAGVHFWNDQVGVAYGATYSTSYNNQIAIYTTTDGGNNWIKVTGTNMPAQLPGEGVGLWNLTGFFSVQGDTVWFGTTKNRIFRSTDRGLSWQVFSTPVANPNYISSVTFKNSQIGLALAYNPLKLIKTTDGGQTWTNKPLTIPGDFRGAQVEYIPGTSSTWYIVASPDKYMVSYNDGDTWEIVNSNIEVWALQFLDSKTAFAGSYINNATQGGAYRWTGPPLGNRWYVNDDATGANNGSSWADAYTDLKSALTAASIGDQIWVAAGTYKPAAPGGTSTSTYTVNKSLQILGGFEGIETAADQRDPSTNPTILSGDLNGNDVDDDFSSATRSDNVVHVLSISSGSANTPFMDGFTIQGGHADGGTNSNGGGVLCLGAPTFKNCIFRQNYCQGGGAGFYANGSSAQGFVIENCRFENNLASIASGSAGGGGISVVNVKGVGFTVRDCIFDGNKADWMGGIDVENSNGFVEGTTFTGNSTPRHGGALRVRYEQGHNNLNFKVRDCIFENNKASFGGGMYGLLSSQNCSIEVVHSSFIENVAETPMLTGWDNSYGGFGTYLTNTAVNTSISIDSCLFERNSTSFNHSACGVETDGANTTLNIRNSIFRENTNTGYWGTVGIWPYGPTSTTIEHCLFENNNSVYTGGLDLGPLESEADYVVRNCQFFNNQAHYSGALTMFGNQGSKVNYLIEDCEMQGNSALTRAGAIWVLSSSEDFNARIDRCTIRNNDCPGGSAIGFNGADPTIFPITALGPNFAITNCLIEGNTSSAAIAGDSLPGIRLINSTIAHNHGGIALADSSSITLQNTILYNPGYPEYQALTNDVSFSSNGGNLIGDLSLSGQLLPSDKENLDPLFIGSGDYHLGMGSPAINMGVDLGNLSALDLDGKARVIGSAVDMGAYESLVVGTQQVSTELLSVSPNPATEFLTMLLPESTASTLDLQVFDMEGRELMRRNLAAGQVLDVRDLLPGTFTLKVVAGERVYVSKFVKQ